ncbi:30890_t:CDS:1, partial [Racocetra persica]
FDLLTNRLTPTYRIITAVIILAASIYVFTLFSPITYGESWTRSDCNKLKLLSSWDYNCDLYDKNYIEKTEEDDFIEIDIENSPGTYYTKSPEYLTQVVEVTYTTKGMEWW